MDGPEVAVELDGGQYISWDGGWRGIMCWFSLWWGGRSWWQRFEAIRVIGHDLDGKPVVVVAGRGG